MGAGGIINQHAQILLDATMKPAVYDHLCPADKDAVEAIHVKPFLSRTQDDVNFLLDKLSEVCRH